MTLSFEQNERKVIQIYTNELINQVSHHLLKAMKRIELK
jgi:hypothetical protein